MRTVLATLVLVTTAACASTGEHRTRDRNMLTLEEIQGADQMTAYDVVRVLRPQWLRTRGPSSFYNENPITIYVDGNRMGGPETLEGIPTINVESMRFFSPSEAQSRFGLNNTNGAIAVTTRRG